MTYDISEIPTIPKSIKPVHFNGKCAAIAWPERENGICAFAFELCHDFHVK